jgi:uncharacterized protein (DUF1697 family)
MTQHIALLRGINVGGNNMLAMKDLSALLEQLGCANIKTYIQSGNVIFDGASAKTEILVKKIGAAIAKSHGFQPHILVLDKKEMAKIAAANPFPKAAAEPKSLHVFFLDAPPKKPDLGSLTALKTESESFKLIGKAFYLHAPDGIHRSKLAARAEKLLGVAATARNWNTVVKVLELAE